MASKSARPTVKRAVKKALAGTNLSGSQRKTAVSPSRSRSFSQLSTDLWNIPATRYIVGGLAIAALIPLTRKLLSSFPEVDTYIHDQMDAMEERLEDVGHRVSDRISSFRGESSDVADNAH